MAIDYSGYSYARTLQCFEAYYPFDTEDVHYADVILSMNQSKSIDEMLPIYEHVKEKIKKISHDVSQKLPKNIIDEISKYSSSNPYYEPPLYEKIRFNMESDIATCYDDNIIRILREKENISKDFCGECFLNLSWCSKYSKYKENIIQIAREKAGIDVTELLESIAQRKSDVFMHWEEYKKFDVKMNGYYQARQKVADDVEFLLKYNWRDTKLYEEFLPTNENEGEKEKEIDTILNKPVETKNDHFVLTLISTIVVGGIIVFLVGKCASSYGVGGYGDHTGENWLLLIALFILYMKWLKK